uniref:Uncharacterized protein n=1 Tax=Acrobeloides nanus TaxID=290746 RepID=A0A914D3R4_9BILA
MNWLPRIGSSKKERIDVEIILHTKDATLEKVSEIFDEDSEILTMTESIFFSLLREKINKDIKKICQIVPYMLSKNPEWREKLQGSFMTNSSVVHNDRKYSVPLTESIDYQKYVFEFHKFVEGQPVGTSLALNKALDKLEQISSQLLDYSSKVFPDHENTNSESKEHAKISIVFPNSQPDASLSGSNKNLSSSPKPRN